MGPNDSRSQLRSPGPDYSITQLSKGTQNNYQVVILSFRNLSSKITIRKYLSPLLDLADKISKQVDLCKTVLFLAINTGKKHSPRGRQHQADRSQFYTSNQETTESLKFFGEAAFSIAGSYRTQVTRISETDVHKPSLRSQKIKHHRHMQKLTL